VNVCGPCTTLGISPLKCFEDALTAALLWGGANVGAKEGVVETVGVLMMDDSATVGALMLDVVMAVGALMGGSKSILLEFDVGGATAAVDAWNVLISTGNVDGSASDAGREPLLATWRNGQTERVQDPFLKL
jgi:hypothetical protein